MHTCIKESKGQNEGGGMWAQKNRKKATKGFLFLVKE